MIDTAAAKARLEAQLAELKARLAHLSSDLGEEADQDWADRAIQREDDDSLTGQAALVEQEIASTTRALARIDAGTYGECVSCGGEIAEGRLNVRPEASLCIGCAGGV
jgi:DnaK suppressor protein